MYGCICIYMYIDDIDISLCMLQRREVEEERKRRRADERMESEKRKGPQYSRGTHVRGPHMQRRSRFWGTPGMLKSAVGAPPFAG
jgi:hypothetical protein